MPSPLQKIARRLFSCFGANRIDDYGNGNRIDTAGATFKDNRVQFFGHDNRIVLESGALATNLKITIVGSRNQIRLGQDVQFLEGHIWCSSADGIIRIGEKTTIAEATLTLTEPRMAITIGRDCLISWQVDLRCGDGHPIVDQATGAVLNPARPITLGDHVWLAAHVQVLKGVTIGEHSVIGTHSLVTHDVPPHAVAAGAPARVLRENITWYRDAKDVPTVAGLPA
jgi:acetyltransferase-like isoleucine patch superfamily enzyme